jgi:hypothetical protein
MKRFVAALAVVAACVTAAGQPARRSISLVVVGGTVITENAAPAILSPGALAIDGADIVEVGTPPRSRQSIQARKPSTHGSDCPSRTDQYTYPRADGHTRACGRPRAHGLAAEYIFPAEAKTVSPSWSASARGSPPSR